MNIDGSNDDQVKDNMDLLEIGINRVKKRIGDMDNLRINT